MRVFKIEDTEITVRQNWSGVDKINARSTMSFTSDDIGTLINIYNGQSFTMYTDATETEIIFAGIIKKVKKFEQYPGKLSYRFSVVDNSAKADKRIIAKVYENTLMGDIVKDLITEKLSAEGVTQGNIKDGPIISKAVFNYIKVSQALDYLKKVTGYIWNINNDDTLDMIPRSENLCPVILDDTVQHHGFVIESNMDQYRNTQYVRGGKVETALQEDEVPTPKPDGESRNFILRFPLASKPRIFINTVEVDPNDIGINGIDENKKWYWSKNSNTITQDTTETVLIDTDTITVDSVGLRNLFLVVDSPEEINNRKDIETGTSGIYEHLSVEKSIDDEKQGLEFAEGEIETYGEILDVVTYKTNVSNIKAGQLQRIQKSLYGVNEDYLIESVSMRPYNHEKIEYTIKALDGAAIGGWEEFFKEIVRKQADFAINENEVIILLQNQSETQTVSGVYDIETFTPPVVAETLICSETLLCGGPVIEGVVIND